MKQYDDLKNLIRFLDREGIGLSSKQQEKLKNYLGKLVAFSVSHRIVSRNDIDFIVNKHFLSSFFFVRQIKKTLSRNDSILDLGSGAGFPGILISLCFEKNKVVLIDSVRKKTLFLKKMIKELGLFCEVVNVRIEDFKLQYSEEFRFITARALASVDDLLKLSSPFLSYGELHTIKGLDYNKEYTSGKDYNFSEEKFPSNWADYSGYLENKVYLTIK